MDEPLSNLDAKMRVETRAELIKLHRRLGITTIYVTHDQLEAMTMGDRIAVMQDGRVQQVATPLGLFHNPLNSFVAGFIGTPPMNFAEAILRPSDGVLTLDAGDFQVKLPPAKADAAKDHIGKPVLFGIRPNDIYDRAQSPIVQPSPDNTVVTTVEVLEPMGAEAVLYLAVGDTKLIASVDSGTRARENEPLQVVLDLTRSYLFDQESGQAIFTAATGNPDLLLDSPAADG
jgi:multiple sugar transport system ATP-binding protein